MIPTLVKTLIVCVVPVAAQLAYEYLSKDKEEDKPEPKDKDKGEED